MGGRGKVFVLRVPEGEELLSYLNEFLESNSVKMGSMFILGSLKKVKLAYLNVKTGEYVVNEMEGFYELLGLGNVSLKEGKPFAHIHIVLGDEGGRAYMGHLVEGVVFVAEVVIVEFTGEEALERRREYGSLWLWPLKVWSSTL
ncbi:MAG: DNA-binding protein [Thermoprotei archaeon]|nr:DNA-binding protein [Thermoprotei archaeon]